MLKLDERNSGHMADQDMADLAFLRAWSIYLMINKHVHHNDERRSTLERFLRKRCEAGEGDLEALTVEGLTYLRKLDELGDRGSSE